MKYIDAYIKDKAKIYKIGILWDGIFSIRKLYRVIHYLKILGIRKWFFVKNIESFIDLKENVFLILVVKRSQEIVGELDKVGLFDLKIILTRQNWNITMRLFNIKMHQRCQKLRGIF